MMMWKYAYTDEVADVAQTAGDIQILAARRGIAAWVIVDKDHRRRAL